MSTSPNHLTVSQIARLAGVSPSAVSNWRRRDESFPRVVAHGSTGDLFARADVERWLEARRERRSSPREQAWSAASIDAIRPYEDAIEVALDLLCLTSITPDLVTAGNGDADEAAIGEKIRAALARSADVDGTAVPTSDALLENPQLTTQVLRWLQTGLATPAGSTAAPARERVAELFEQLLELRSSRRLRTLAESRTASWAAELVITLAEADHGLVLDPAAGEGGFLLAADAAASRGIKLIGWEHDPRTLRIAIQRLRVHQVRAELQQLDSLGDAGLNSLGADAVVCDAPFGLKQDAERWSPTDPRWSFGLPAPIADLGWLQLALHHLRPDGRAAVLLPAASLYRGGSEARTRVELLNAGVVEAIVALPAGTALHTDTPVALWLLQGTAHKSSAEVLLIDAAADTAAAPRDQRTSPTNATTQKLRQAILEVVQGRRKGDQRIERLPGFAATVAAAELIEADADLVPSRWATAPSSDEEIKRRATTASRAHARAREALSARPHLTLPLKPGGNVSRRRRIRELIAQQRLEIIPGTRVPSSAESSDGTRVLGVWDFRGEGRRFISTTAGLPRTEPNDVVVMPAAGAFDAFVDAEGEHVIASPLQAIRITSHPAEGSEPLDPRLIAAFIARPGATMFSSGTAGRSSVKDIDIPLFDAATTLSLAEALAELDVDEQLARAATAAAGEFRRALLEAANAGWGAGGT